MSKTTVVIGASEKPSRYSFLATVSLKKHGHKVIPLGNREGKIEGETIITGKPEIKDVDTVTLYLNPDNQKSWYDYILNLKPRRIVFNPGTENPELYKMAAEQGIECEVACTLVLLSTGQY